MSANDIYCVTILMCVSIAAMGLIPSYIWFKNKVNKQRALIREISTGTMSIKSVKYMHKNHYFQSKTLCIICLYIQHVNSLWLKSLENTQKLLVVLFASVSSFQFITKSTKQTIQKIIMICKQSSPNGVGCRLNSYFLVRCL